MSGRLLRLAWRNLWRNPRRTLIAMAAIGFGYVMLLFVACLMAGLRQQMIESGTGLVLSDIEVHAPAYYPKDPFTRPGAKGPTSARCWLPSQPTPGFMLLLPACTATAW
jgi:ABC-type lipoprotein release transport system permease subunit